MEKTATEFNAAFGEWMAAAQEKVNAGYVRFSHVKAPVLKYEVGNKYVKVVTPSSVFCFVDRTTGDVLKAASWKAPAKHARGNLFTGKIGVTAYGAEYM